MEKRLNYEQLGIRVCSYRQKIGLTQKELADAAGCSVTHISNIENNYTIPSIELLMGLCSIFKITPDYLLLGIDHDNDVMNIQERLQLCTKEQGQFFCKLLDLTIVENQQSQE